MSQKQLSIRVPSPRSASPALATNGSSCSHKSELQLQLEDILDRVTTSSAGNNTDDDDDDDDAYSSYGDDDDENENELLDDAADAGLGVSSPGLYAELASLNPYADAAADDKDGDALVCRTIAVPVRAESHEEALARLSGELESIHNVMRAEESAARRFLQTLPLDGEEDEGADQGFLGGRFW